ncbi:MAG: hypothetical protein ACK559_16780, partial [bacterium]
IIFLFFFSHRISQEVGKPPRKKKIREKFHINPLHSIFREEAEEETLSDNMEDMCLVYCEVCGKAMKYLRVHAKSNHSLSPMEYRSAYPGPVRFAKKTFHRYPT